MKPGQKIKHLLRHFHTMILARAAGVYCKNRPQTAQNRTLELVLLLSRPQDIDLYRDIYQQSLSLSTISVSFWATRRAVEDFPDTRKLLAKHKLNVDFTVEHRNLKEAIRRLRNVDALLNTVESSFAAHKVPHRLTKIANACGCLTFTLQHGFENLGLTYSEPEFGSRVTFAASRVLTWSRSADLPGHPAPETLQKCIAVGCPKVHLQQIEKSVTRPGEKLLVSVFEGLHVARFNAAYRDRFFADLQSAAEEFKELQFLLKPHPGIIKREAGHAAALRRLKNIEVIDPGDPQPQTCRSTPELLSRSLAVVTTPSTIALDAALTETPVAVTRYQQKISYYNLYYPLPLLDKAADWRRFLNEVLENREKSAENTAAFLSRVMLPGNAAERILETIFDQWHSASTGSR